MAAFRLRGSTPCIEGTPGVDTLPFALEEPGETVIVKQCFDGFQTAELLAHLRGHRRVDADGAAWGRDFV
jgi:hypothetical protein